MHRIKLINHKGVMLTEDTVQALQILETQAHSSGRWGVLLLGPKSKEVLSAPIHPLSLERAGRVVHLRLFREDVGDAQAALNATWGHAVPLGFTPWLRYPLVRGDNTDAIFHFYGPWQPLLDRMLSEGRGHLAYPSMVAAAQSDLGIWEGDKPQERFVQAQLHRIGKNPGPVDGAIGPRTVQVIQSLGVERGSLPQVAEYLRMAELPKVTSEVRRTGHLVAPGQPLRFEAYGGVKAVKTAHGATLTIDGPGRLVVDVGEIQ